MGPFAWSPDGTLVTAARRLPNGGVIVWDAQTGEERFSIPGPPVTCLAWAPNNTHMVWGTENSITICDVRSQKVIHTFPAHKTRVHRVDYSPDGTRLASVADSRLVRIWDATTWKQTCEVRMGTPLSATWSPDGKYLTSVGGYDGPLANWDTTTGNRAHTLKHVGRWSVGRTWWSPDGRSLTSINPLSYNGTSGQVEIWDPRTGKTITVLREHNDRVKGIAWSSDGTRLASASKDGTVKVWDPAQRTEPFSFAPDSGCSVRAISFSPDGRRLASAGYREDTVKISDAATGHDLLILRGHANVVSHVAWSIDGTRLASGDAKGILKIWDATNGEVLHTLKAHSSTIHSIAWSPDGSRLATAGWNENAVIWDPIAGKSIRTFPTEMLRGPDGVISVAWSPDGTRLATTRRTGKVQIWDPATGKETCHLKGHTLEAGWVVWSPDGTRLASSGQDRAIRIWDATTGQEINALGYIGEACSLAWHPDGTRLASAGTHDIKIWDPVTGQEVINLAVHERDYGPGESRVVVIAWSPDGLRLAAGSSNSPVTIFDATKGYRLAGKPAPAAKKRPALVGPAQTQAEPFVILPRDGRAEKKLATLAEAVLLARDGDTIEVRGNGPFPLDPIVIKGPALRIRAGEGFWPVFHIRQPGQGERPPLAFIVTHSLLILEGLEFQDIGLNQPVWFNMGTYLIYSQQAPLYLANCRYAAKCPCYKNATVFASGSSHCEMCNCEILGIQGFGLFCTSTNRTVVRNNIIMVGGRPFDLHLNPRAKVDVQLTRNTFVGGVIAWQYSEGNAPAAPIAGIKASGNIFHGKFDDRFYVSLPAQAGQAGDHMRRCVTWTGDHNLFAPKARLIFWTKGMKQTLTVSAGLTDWRRLWGDPETDSLEGQPRFVVLNLVSRAPEQLTPEAFRLHPESPGHAAGPDGQDLGADVDLVGPGPAYERWKKTPAYQEWLKITGLLRTKSPSDLLEHRKAIELDPKSAYAHNNLGLALRDQGDLASAVAEFRKAIDLKPDYAEAHCNLGDALRRQGEFQAALEELCRGHELGLRNPHWRYPSAAWVRRYQRLIDLDGQLPDILAGKAAPASAGERIELAQLCSYKRLHRAAAHFYEDAFAAEPKLADDLNAQHRYNAACAAALAGCGQGKDADQLDSKERARLRQQALDWLRADLKSYQQLMNKPAGKAGPVIAQRMQHWLADTDFAGLRGEEALAKLPEAERQAWQKQWQEAEVLRRSAAAKTKLPDQPQGKEGSPRNN
jgi:WD40 repeat protein/tetratricopeptide (TPR) repeat protein